MLFFKKRQRLIDEKRQEAQIQAIHKDMYKKIAKSTESIEKLARLLDDEGVTGRIFLATGGDRRMRDDRQR